ncbi:hypothetical protein NRM5_009040 [Chlamydia psittaci]|nr:hypothetical protein NRM5_009040 [Chlamydia psittaci]
MNVVFESDRDTKVACETAIALGIPPKGPIKHKIAMMKNIPGIFPMEEKKAL